MTTLANIPVECAADTAAMMGLYVDRDGFGGGRMVTISSRVRIDANESGKMKRIRFVCH
jgi:hypothetical protein